MRDFIDSIWRDRARLLQGAALGALVTVAVGFNWVGGYKFHWMMVTAASSNAMVPICADQFLALGPDAQAEYKNIKATDRDDVVRKHLKKVGAVTVDYSFAKACASAIDVRAQTAAKPS